MFRSASMAEPTPAGSLPRIIWILWLQGWENAPRMALASQSSWLNRNPDWTVHSLSRENVGEFLPTESLKWIFSGSKPHTILADLVRLELLRIHGGVWADATTICAEPLDDWLPKVMPHGFFAFSRPAPSRMISTWFLAAEKDSAIVAAWHKAAIAYWERTVDGDYFWLNYEFATAYHDDAKMRTLWDESLPISAQHPFHFWPDDKGLTRKATPAIEALLADPPSPVFKLTHKFTSEPKADSVFERLLDYANGSGPKSPAGGNGKLAGRLHRAIRKLRGPWERRQATRNV